ncbi:MAG: hypothetical protein HGA54_08140 [Actinobacteria bacterium]|nr:hypothetical protein [Actinomycetota bacterium]
MSPKYPFRSTWGLSFEEWEDARARMRALLVDSAGTRKTITYGDVSREVFHGRFSARSSALFQMLEEVCTIEDGDRGISLGSVVVRKDSGIPGKGYFLFASQSLGRAFDPSNMKSCRAFWEIEVNRVWDVYAGPIDSSSEGWLHG